VGELSLMVVNLVEMGFEMLGFGGDGVEFGEGGVE
jgi:hypothetical protein